MAKSVLQVRDDLARAFVQAQDGKTRFVQISIQDEQFVLSAVGAASASPAQDLAGMIHERLTPQQATLCLVCLDVHAPALRWVILAFVPDSVSVRDKMLYSSARDSLKRQLGLNYFIGEFHATELSEVTLAAFENAKKKQSADTEAPLTESERLLKETARMDCDTSVRSTAMSVIPFTISQDVRNKLTLFQQGKLDWITLQVNPDDESVDEIKSVETVDLADVQSLVDPSNPSFVAYRCRSSVANGADAPLFLYVCPENAPIRLKMVYSTCKATVLAATTALGITFTHTIEINNVATAAEEICAELAPPKADEQVAKQHEFSRPAAPGRGRGRGRRFSRPTAPGQ